MKLKSSAVVKPDTISWRIILLHKHKSLSVQTGFLSSSDRNYFGAEIAYIFNIHSQPAAFCTDEALVHILSLQGASERFVRKNTLLQMSLVVWYPSCQSAHQHSGRDYCNREQKCHSLTQSYSVWKLFCVLEKKCLKEFGFQGSLGARRSWVPKTHFTNALAARMSKGLLWLELVRELQLSRRWWRYFLIREPVDEVLFSDVWLLLWYWDTWSCISCLLFLPLLQPIWLWSWEDCLSWRNFDSRYKTRGFLITLMTCHCCSNYSD